MRRALVLMALLGSCTLLTTGCVTSAVVYKVGDRPADAFVVDVNGDKRADVLVANAGSDSVTVLLQGKHGWFGDRLTLRLPKGAEPWGVTAGVYRAGRLSVVTANRGKDSISVFDTIADGAAPTETIPLGPGSQPAAVETADVDDDGTPDLLVTSKQPTLFGCPVNGCLLLFLGDAKGGLRYSGKAMPVGDDERKEYDPRDIAATDYDRDGKTDVWIALRGSDEVILVEGLKKGWESQEKYQRWPLESAVRVESYAYAVGGKFYGIGVIAGSDRAVGALTWQSFFAVDRYKKKLSFHAKVSRGAFWFFQDSNFWPEPALLDEENGNLTFRGGAGVAKRINGLAPGLTRMINANLDGDDVWGSDDVVGIRASMDDVWVAMRRLVWDGPESLVFGEEAVGAEKRKTFETRASSLVEDRSGKPEISGPDAASFRVVATCGKPTAERCKYEIAFAPTSAGAKEATLVLPIDGHDKSVTEKFLRLRGGYPAIALTGTGVASPPPPTPTRFGVADDYGKYAADAGAWFFGELRALGMTENRMTVLWRSGQVAPDPVETAFLDRSVARAQADGVALVFSVYPGSASAHDPAQFCPFVRGLAQRYPYVREFIVGNEPNKADFWSPVDPAAYTQLLAACYDALKPLGVTVIGGALSPRSVGSGMSPVLFLAGMGAEYRRLARTAPLLDMLSHHPYPNPERIGRGVDAGYDWPNAGIPDLDRLKQVFEDAFAGTAQPTFATTLKLKLDEVGWQANVLPPLASLYTGAENSATVEEAQQAEYYRTLIGRISCDADVAELLLFHLIDEKELNASAASGGWQSGLLRIDRSRRPSFDAAGAAIGAGCTGGAPAWTPAATVVGGRAAIGAVQQQVRFRGKPQRGVKFTFEAAAAEGVSWRIEVKNAAGKVVAAKSGARDAPFDASTFVTPVLVGAGSYTATLKLSAATNGTRTLTASKTAASKP